MRDQGMKYIDNSLWNMVNAACRKQIAEQKARGESSHCTISASDEQGLLVEAQKHIKTVKEDPGVAAFWILDDYPSGNISSTLKALHDLINTETAGSKPTICGIGGSLDHRSQTDPHFKPDRSYTERSLVNLTPAACDIVAPYFYGAAKANDPTWIDWTMADLLPWFLRQLQRLGFDQPQLMPLLHAFSAPRTPGGTYYVQPRPRDIEAQASAYCAVRPVAVMFFTWRSRDAQTSYAGDAQIREGVMSGASKCWNH